jgi:hypothetical protein
MAPGFWRLDFPKSQRGNISQLHRPSSYRLQPPVRSGFLQLCELGEYGGPSDCLHGL